MFNIESNQNSGKGIYSFLDKNITSEKKVVYYQLISINYNNQKKFYSPVFLQLYDKFSLKIYPNPGDGIFYLNSSLSKNTQIMNLDFEIFDNKKSLVKKINLILKNQTNTLMDLTDLPDGQYFLRTFYGNEITIPFIINKSITH